MASQDQEPTADGFSPAFRLKKPLKGSRASAGRFIFNSPHSGRTYPGFFLKQSKLPLLRLRSSEDAYVDELFAHTPAQGATFLHSLVPRAYLDLNRQPFELDPLLFRDPLPDFAVSDTRKTGSGLGVIARIVSEGQEIYAEKLPLEEGLERISNYYFPYHKALRALVEAALERHKQAILIDCHSMPSGALPGFAQIPPDFVLGNLFDTSCDYELLHMVRSFLQQMGYVVSVNKPYAGGYVTKEYGHPRANIHTLQIEINRSLYLNERTLQKHAGFDRLQKNLSRLTEKLITSLPDLATGSRLAAE